MFEHSVQNSQQLAHTGCQGHLFGLPGGAQALIEGPDNGLKRVATRVAIYRAARTCALPPHTLRLPRRVPLSRLSGATPTRLAACLRPKVPSSGMAASIVKESTGPTPGTLLRRLSRSRHRGWCEGSPQGIVQVPQLPLQIGDMGPDSLAYRGGSSAEPVLLGGEHRYHLPPANQEGLQSLGLGIGQGAWCRPHRLAEVSQHLGIYGVRLSQLPHGLGEVPYLPGVDHYHWQPPSSQATRCGKLQATRGLQAQPERVAFPATRWIEGWEYFSYPGQSLFVVSARNARRILATWWSRRQYTWDSGTTSVADILKFILARGGLEISTTGASSEATTLQPSFTIHPGESGASAVRRLLEKVPDVLLFQGHQGSLVEPQAWDATDYSYGTDHVILQGRYQSRAQEYNRIQVFDRLLQVHDLNLDTSQKTQDRANATLREQLLASLDGEIAVPANCGQELYDVIEITDSTSALPRPSAE